MNCVHIFEWIFQAAVKKREQNNDNTNENSRAKRPRMERETNWGSELLLLGFRASNITAFLVSE